MDFSNLSMAQWGLAALAAWCVGLSKSGFAGVGMMTVILMAMVMEGHELASTGAVLPLLIAGDVMAVTAFRKHVMWREVFRILPPAAIGVVIGYSVMGWVDNASFKPLIGWIILLLTLLQAIRGRFPDRFTHVPHHPAFAWTLGIAAGVVTMLANAAGPLMTLYLLALALPKLWLVGTAAWYFLIVNLFKVPFSSHLGLIDAPSLWFNLKLVPWVAIGILSGKALLHRIPQRWFEALLLWLAAASALYLIVV